MELYDAELEMRVLRTVCTRRNPQAARLLARIDESFFRRSHCRFIYRRIRAGITARGRPPTWTNLRTDTSNRIPDREQTKRYIKLMADVRPLPGAADAGDYDDLFDDLKRLRTARLMWDTSQNTMKALEGDDPDIDSLLDGLSDSVSSARTASTNIETLRLAAKDDNSDEIFKQLLSDERPDVVPTGFKAFDSGNRGLLKGTLLVLAATKKGGKSSLSIQLALQIAKQPSCFNVCIIPLEMSRERMAARIYANEAGINKTRLIAFPLSPDEKRKLRAARKELKEALAKSEGALIIDDSMVGASVEDLLNMRTHHDDDVIIIDQLTLTANAAPTDQRQWAHMNEATRFARNWAEKNNKVVVIVTQLDEHGNIKYTRGPAEHADLVWTWVAEELEAGEEEATLNVQVLSRHQDPTPFTLGMNIYTGRVYDVDKTARSSSDYEQPAKTSRGRGRKVNRRTRAERQDDTDIDSYLDTSADD